VPRLDLDGNELVICTKCGKQVRREDCAYRKRQCKPCRSAYMKVVRPRYKEKNREYMRQRRQADAETNS